MLLKVLGCILLLKERLSDDSLPFLVESKILFNVSKL